MLPTQTAQTAQTTHRLGGEFYKVYAQ